MKQTKGIGSRSGINCCLVMQKQTVIGNRHPKVIAFPDLGLGIPCKLIFSFFNIIQLNLSAPRFPHHTHRPARVHREIDAVDRHHRLRLLRFLKAASLVSHLLLSKAALLFRHCRLRSVRPLLQQVYLRLRTLVQSHNPMVLRRSFPLRHPVLSRMLHRISRVGFPTSRLLRYRKM